MSQVQAQAQVDSLQDQYYTTLATAGRLLAERDNLSEIRFSPVFDTLKDSPRVAEIIALQVQLFLLDSKRCEVKLMVSGSPVTVFVFS